MAKEEKKEEKNTILHYPFRADIVEKKCLDIAKIIFDTELKPPLSLEEASFILTRFQKSLEEIRLTMQYTYLTQEFLIPILTGKPVDAKPLGKDNRYFS